MTSITLGFLRVDFDFLQDSEGIINMHIPVTVKISLLLIYLFFNLINP